MAVFEVACVWEPLVGEREEEKSMKYQALAADLAKQWKGFRITVTPVVLGVIGGLRCHLAKSGLFDERAVEAFAAEAQREVLVASVKAIRRHLAL